MGQAQSKKNYNLPLGKNFIISYCRHHSIKKEQAIHEEINLEKIVSGDSTLDLILSVFNYHLSHNGINVKCKNIQPFRGTLHEILLGIKGSYKHPIETKCYFSEPTNIKALLTNGNVLIAGIIIDSEFANDYLDTNFTNTRSDIVLIVGYTQNEYIIKTTWCLETIKLPWESLGNIKEVWNISVKNPENEYLEIKNIEIE